MANFEANPTSDGICIPLPLVFLLQDAFSDISSQCSSSTFFSGTDTQESTYLAKDTTPHEQPSDTNGTYPILVKQEPSAVDSPVNQTLVNGVGEHEPIKVDPDGVAGVNGTTYPGSAGQDTVPDLVGASMQNSIVDSPSFVNGTGIIAMYS